MTTVLIIAPRYWQAEQIARLRHLTNWQWAPTETAADRLIERARSRGVVLRTERVLVGSWASRMEAAA